METNRKLVETMTPEEVNREVARLIPDLLAAKAIADYRDFCSPDAPHSLIVAMVEAVIKAGRIRQFCSALFAVALGGEWEGDDFLDDAMNEMEADGESEDACMAMSLVAVLLRAVPETIARAFLAAMRSGEGEG